MNFCVKDLSKKFLGRLMIIKRHYYCLSDNNGKPVNQCKQLITQPMKYFLSFSLISFFIFSSKVYSQDVIKMSACKDENISRQADSIRREASKQGFIVAKEASMSMESEFEMAVLVPLTEGSWYQFVFIGDVTSRLYEVRMYDSDEKQVVYQKKLWGDVDGNVISFSYIPKFSEFYAIRPVQVNKKKKNLCGYVMLLKKIK
jgi:hypothetical protein